MPELPEVETIVRSLAPHVQDCCFVKTELLKESALHPASLPVDRLGGMKIRSLFRRGKLVVFSLSEARAKVADELALVIHLRMTGRILTPGANEGLGKHTRCVFTLEKPEGGNFKLFFDDARTFGKILLCSPRMLAEWPFWRDMGPEPFDLAVEDFQRALAGRRPLKGALLDQTVIAGIGNIYADESLFAAGLHPLRQSGSLGHEEARNLLDAIRKTLAEAIAKKGSSIRDYRDADGNQGTFQKSFAVYGRGGKECKKCGSTLEKIRIGGRATVFCPSCQGMPAVNH